MQLKWTELWFFFFSPLFLNATHADDHACMWIIYLPKNKNKKNARRKDINICELLWHLLQTKMLQMCTEETIEHTLPDCMPVPPQCQTRQRACHWQSIQRKFHNICLLSHNGARCSTGSGAEDEAEAKPRVCATAGGPAKGETRAFGRRRLRAGG